METEQAYHTFRPRDLHRSLDTDEVTPISKYGDCGFTLTVIQEDMEEREVRCTLIDALEEVRQKQFEINGDDFDAMGWEDDLMTMLDRWAFETEGEWLEDMHDFIIDINVRGGIPKAPMNASPDSDDPYPIDSPEMAFRKTWENVINVDAINNMDKETLDRVWDIVKDI